MKERVEFYWNCVLGVSNLTWQMISSPSVTRLFMKRLLDTFSPRICPSCYLFNLMRARSVPMGNKTLWSHQWIIASREKPSTKTIQKVKKNHLKPRKSHLKPRKIIWSKKKKIIRSQEKSSGAKVIWSHPKWSQTGTSHVTVNENHP